MKNFFITVCTLLPLIVASQNVNLVGKNYIANADLFVKQYDPTTKSSLKDAEKIFSKSWVFYVVAIADDNNLIIKQWPLGETNNKKDITKAALKATDASKDLKAYAGAESNNLFFVLDLKQFNDKTAPYFGTSFDLAVGIMTIPIKARGGNDKDRFFEFEEKFNLGLSVGPRWHIKGRKERSLSLLFNSGVSSVRMDSLNTKGYVNTANNTSALTFGIGTLYQEGNINVGIFMGWDKVAGLAGKNWIYQSKPWFGIAIGVSLFNVNISSGL